MTNEVTMTKKDLLEIAKAMNITGRHDMTRDELYDAVAAKSVPAVEASDEMFSNFIATKPFRGRPYNFVRKIEDNYATLPPQAKKIFDFMEETHFVGRGDHIVKAAVEAGKLKTTQDYAVLFAFYARKLEEAGIKLAI